jgi:hypothetical protein
MRYLIDGYNLLHATGHLSGRVGPHGLEKARQALLGRLAALVKTGAGVTVVFDAHGAPPIVEREQTYQGVRVCFALGGAADDVIEDLIRRDSAPRLLTVVSDDRRLKDAARRRQCPTPGCLDFYDEIDKAPPPAPPDEVPDRPPTLSEREVKGWLQAFGGADDE